MALPSALEPLVRNLLRGEVAALSDGELLERYIAQRDEPAFETLVRRHGPMVLATCRRILGRLHDAEDAFQATFLVLACRARNVWPRDAVGAFLHGVAYRTSLKARGRLTRLRQQETQVVELPQPVVNPVEIDEVRPIIDRELERLPEKYRVAVVLCELEGQPRKEVARQLGLAEGTLSSRLATARKMLAARLTRRGVPLTSAALGVWLEGQCDAAPVPPALTTQAVTFVHVGTSTLPIPETVTALTEGVIPLMIWKKIVLSITVAMGLVVMAGTGAMSRYGRTEAAEPPLEQPKTAPLPQVLPRIEVELVDRQPEPPVYFDFEVKKVEAFFIKLVDTPNPPRESIAPVFAIRYNVTNRSERPCPFRPNFQLFLADDAEAIAPKVIPKFEALVDENLGWRRLDRAPLEADGISSGYATWDVKVPQEGDFTVFVEGVNTEVFRAADQKPHIRVLALDFRGGPQPTLVRRRWELRPMRVQVEQPAPGIQFNLELTGRLDKLVDAEESARALSAEAHLNQQLAIAQLEKVLLMQQLIQLDAEVKKYAKTEPLKAEEFRKSIVQQKLYMDRMDKKIADLQKQLRENMASQNAPKALLILRADPPMAPVPARIPMDGIESILIENGKVRIEQSGQTMIIEGGRVMLDAKNTLQIDGGKIEIRPKKK